MSDTDHDTGTDTGGPGGGPGGGATADTSAGTGSEGSGVADEVGSQAESAAQASLGEGCYVYEFTPGDPSSGGWACNEATGNVSDSGDFRADEAGSVGNSTVASEGETSAGADTAVAVASEGETSAGADTAVAAHDRGGGAHHARSGEGEATSSAQGGWIEMTAEQGCQIAANVAVSGFKSVPVGTYTLVSEMLGPEAIPLGMAADYVAGLLRSSPAAEKVLIKSLEEYCDELFKQEADRRARNNEAPSIRSAP
jgi:hypothetical protein